MEYQGVLREPLIGVYRTAEKLNAARATISKWRQHAAAGTLPTHLRSKAPSVQFTKEYASSEAAKAAQTALQEAHVKASTDALASSIRAKADEITALEDGLGHQAMFSKLSPLITQKGADLLKRMHLPVWTQDANSGELRITGWKPSTAAAFVRDTLLNDILLYAYRLIHLADGKAAKAESKIKAKVELHKDVDIEMADATKPGPSIQSMIDKAVSARLKSAKPVPKVSSLCTSHGLTLTSGSGYGRPRAYAQPYQQSQSSKGERSSEGGLSTPSSWQIRQTNVRRHQDEEEHLDGSEEETSETSIREEWQGQDDVPEEEVVNSSSVCNFKYGHPSTIPDWLLSVPYPRAVQILICNTPLDIVLAAQFKHSVHCSPGVVIPDQFAQDLSVGMRYMFFQPTDSSLLMKAWTDFRRRLAWRLKFAFSGDNNEFYDPDFDAREPSKKQAPSLPLYIEYGLRLGRLYLKDTINHIVPAEPSAAQRALMPKVKQLKEFLTENEYVVTHTDKNLGLAVSKRAWVIEQCLYILQNENDYTPLEPMQARRIMDIKHTRILLVAEQAEVLLWLPQVPDFLRSKLKTGLEEHHIPRFYGIPKIHKKPTRFRPIIPCHSAQQNPAAKYVSKRLKPIIKLAPTIIHGSKDLAIKLSKLELQPTRRAFIVTGDVVAFYPNIDLDKCLRIVTDFYSEHYFEYYANMPDRPSYYSEEALRIETQLFVDCLALPWALQIRPI